ncbi:MAG: YihY/virulence factor BrkB family protein [Clostridia bacterium]|nr:YihY/virulence factor BrkB family protein [Clostridia bacterium]MBQ8511183.1 YihY/virulence factor BrkB family protein [Clostridia bacterium]
MKSRIFTQSSRIRAVVQAVTGDRVSLHAAHASFFVITSAVPFASILFTFVGIFVPDGSPESLFGLTSTPVLPELLGYAASEIRSVPGVSLLSLSAVTTLWSASRGISGIRAGIETIYGCTDRAGYVTHRLRSILGTVLFILLLAATAGILLFGDLLGLPSLKIRFPVFAAVLTAAFTAFFVSVARRSTRVKHEILRHLPGAVFSTIGWIVFSWGYSLYIAHFPSATALYGGLAAVCLMMLWVYFCMVILLLGAEVNKLYFARK